MLNSNLFISQEAVFLVEAVIDELKREFDLVSAATVESSTVHACTENLDIICDSSFRHASKLQEAVITAAT